MAQPTLFARPTTDACLFSNGTNSFILDDEGIPYYTYTTVCSNDTYHGIISGAGNDGVRAAILVCDTRFHDVSGVMFENSYLRVCWDWEARRALSFTGAIVFGVIVCGAIVFLACAVLSKAASSYSSDA